MAELILLIALVGVTLANLGCTIYVAYKMFLVKGPLHALVGFLCCQLYPFIWGWLNSGDLKITDIMIFWSFLVVLHLILQGIVQYLEVSAAMIN